MCKCVLCFLLDVSIIVQQIKQQWRKQNHWEPKPQLVRGAHTTIDTLLGRHCMLKEVGTAPKGLLPWVTQCVKDKKG